jgi:hypothetical protein
MYHLLACCGSCKRGEMELDGENLRNFAEKLWEFALRPRIRC